MRSVRFSASYDSARAQMSKLVGRLGVSFLSQEFVDLFLGLKIVKTVQVEGKIKPNKNGPSTASRQITGLLMRVAVLKRERERERERRGCLVGCLEMLSSARVFRVLKKKISYRQKNKQKRKKCRTG